MNQKELSKDRREFTKGSLLESDVPDNPFALFRQWLAQWRDSGFSNDSTAMTLATTDPQGQPHARIVLLKDLAPSGFVFYTNYNSEKGRNIAANPKVSLLFFWPEQERQVRILGRATQLSRAENRAYFDQRPFESRVGAITSPQSSVIESRHDLDEHYEENLKKYTQSPPECPEHWGGYCVEAHSVEFWQGRANRIHDRLRYVIENHIWKLERLAP